MARTARNKIKPQDTVPSAKIYKTAVYARLSREDNLNGSDSLENQISLIKNYISAHPYLELTEIYSDNGYTGTDFHRPDWQRLMNDIKHGKINCIVVKDFSRLGRNYIETGEFIEKVCPFLKIRFISVNEGFDTETAQNNSQLSMSLSNIINDYYAKDISRKVSSALRTKMLSGDYIGSWEKYGYLKSPENKNRLIVNPETAPVVKQIFRWRSQGMSYMGINRILNELAIPSPSQYKAERGIVTNSNQKDRIILWNKHIITDILNDITYLGHMAQRKNTQCLYAGLPYSYTDKDDWIVVPNTHEAIIDRDLFDRVQKINEETRKNQIENNGKYNHLPKAENIWKGKFFCGDCGAKMKLYRSFNKNKDKVYFTYKCPRYAEHGTHGCNAKKIRKSDLDEAVLTAIKYQFDLFLNMKKTLSELDKKSNAETLKNIKTDKIKDIKNKLEHQKELFSSLYDDLRNGVLSAEDFKQAKDIIRKKIQKLEEELIMENSESSTSEQSESEQQLKIIIQKYRTCKELSPELINAMIKSVELNADSSLTICFNYADTFENMKNNIEKLRKEMD